VVVQADEFEPAPEDPPYRPRKTGVDSSTHMDGEDQPFDFNRDVQPLLAVVVGKTLEQALLEVEQEEELDAIAQHLAKLNEEKEAEAKRVANLEAQTHAGWQAKEGRRASERARLAREKSVREKVASVRLMKQNWPVVFEHTAQALESVGTWVDPITWQIRGDFMPWVYAGVTTELDGRGLGGAVLDSVLECACAAQEKAQRLAKASEEERNSPGGWVRVFLEAKSLGLEEDTVVGPIKVDPNDTIADLERKIQGWLFEQGLSVQIPSDGLLHLALDGRELQGAHRILDEHITNESGDAKLEVILPQLT
jgi:BMFP domain-containing protein YqiC